MILVRVVPDGLDLETASAMSRPCSGRPTPARRISRSSACSATKRGMIGLPLRLLAREVYDKIAARVGADKVALITGEEKIKPESPRYWVCTVEAMPREADVDFLAIDEVQLAADPERGHVFTDRLLHARGRSGDAAARRADHARGDRRSHSRRQLHLASAPVEADLRRREEDHAPAASARAVVAFSASEVYAIAELIRRQRGGAAVVLGALSARARATRRWRSINRATSISSWRPTPSAWASTSTSITSPSPATRKFDGQMHRALTPAELAQIAGRAGRHMNDGTFGVTGGVEPFSADVIERLETHNFDTVQVAAVAQPRSRFRLARAAARQPAPDAARSQRLARARIGRRRHRAGDRQRRPRGRRAWRSRRPPSASCGRCARSPTTARSRRRTTPSWSPRSTSS